MGRHADGTLDADALAHEIARRARQHGNYCTAMWARKRGYSCAFINAAILGRAA